MAPACLALPAAAQTASQITPPDLSPAPADAPEAAVIPLAGGPMPPPGADAVTVRVSDVIVAGATAEMVAGLKAELTGGPITVAQIYAAAGRLEAEYARQGRVLVRITVPAQSLESGATLRLVLIDGFIERIDTAALPAAVAKRIAAILAPLQGRPGVRLAEIERRLLIAAGEPGVALRSSLAPGAGTGGVVLIVEASHRPVSGYVAVDNMLSPALGRYSTAVHVSVNSLLGWGETFYARAVGHPGEREGRAPLGDRPLNRQLAAGMIFPIGLDGLSFNSEAVLTQVNGERHPFFPSFGSRFERISSRLRYPIERRRTANVNAEIGLDVQNEQIRIVDPVLLPISLDRLRVLRFSLDASTSLAGGTFLRADGQASFGLDAIGARGIDDANPLLPLSRQGADAAFRKFEVEFLLVQPVGPHAELSVSARAQTGFGEPLLNSEQFGIASPDGISAIASGTLQGDTGYVARTEFAVPIAARGGVPARLTPYLFATHGQVRFERPTLLERRATSAAGGGVGARLWIGGTGGLRALQLSTEYGAARIAGAGTSHRFSASLVAQF